MNKTVCIAVTLDMDPKIKSKMKIILFLKKKPQSKGRPVTMLFALCVTVLVGTLQMALTGN